MQHVKLNLLERKCLQMKLIVNGWTASFCLRDQLHWNELVSVLCQLLVQTIVQGSYATEQVLQPQN